MLRNVIDYIALTFKKQMQDQRNQLVAHTSIKPPSPWFLPKDKDAKNGENSMDATQRAVVGKEKIVEEIAEEDNELAQLTKARKDDREPHIRALVRATPKRATQETMLAKHLRPKEANNVFEKVIDVEPITKSNRTIDDTLTRPVSLKQIMLIIKAPVFLQKLRNGQD